MDVSGCEICAGLPDFAAADLRDGQTLPEAAARLVDAYPTPPGFWDTSKEYEITKKCPLCGRLYTYNYYYDFAVGCVQESVWLERRENSELTDT